MASIRSGGGRASRTHIRPELLYEHIEAYARVNKNAYSVAADARADFIIYNKLSILHIFLMLLYGRVFFFYTKGGFGNCGCAYIISVSFYEKTKVDFKDCTEKKFATFVMLVLQTKF